MEEHRIPNKIFTHELEGTRRRGRRRKGWKEEVERDLRVLGVRRWREMVTDRKNRTLFNRPKLTAGCKCQWKKKFKLITYSYEPPVTDASKANKQYTQNVRLQQAES
jgi:hypothetical protein